MMIQKTKQKGFTIIECLISLLLLTILLTGGMAFFFYSHQSLRWAIHKRMAAEIANSELENIKNLDYAGLSDPCPYTSNCPNYTLCNDTNHTKNVSIGWLNGQQQVYVCDIDENGGGTDYKEVRVVVSWQEPAKATAQNITLDTYMVP